MNDDEKAARNAADVSEYVACANRWHATASEEEKRRGFPSFAQWLELRKADGEQMERFIRAVIRIGVEDNEKREREDRGERL